MQGREGLGSGRWLATRRSPTSSFTVFEPANRVLLVLSYSGHGYLRSLEARRHLRYAQDPPSDSI